MNGKETRILKGCLYFAQLGDAAFIADCKIAILPCMFLQFITYIQFFINGFEVESVSLDLF